MRQEELDNLARSTKIRVKNCCAWIGCCDKVEALLGLSLEGLRPLRALRQNLPYDRESYGLHIVGTTAAGLPLETALFCYLNC